VTYGECHVHGKVLHTRRWASFRGFKLTRYGTHDTQCTYTISFAMIFEHVLEELYSCQSIAQIIFLAAFTVVIDVSCSQGWAQVLEALEQLKLRIRTCHCSRHLRNSDSTFASTIVIPLPPWPTQHRGPLNIVACSILRWNKIP